MGADPTRVAVDGCPSCGEPVVCGMSNGDDTCWCFALPPAMPMPPAANAVRCYCRTCLQKLIDERTAAMVALARDAASNGDAIKRRIGVSMPSTIFA